MLKETSPAVRMAEEARDNLKNTVIHTPLQFNKVLSEQTGAHIYLKREDLQPVRSYKLRGAYHKISRLNDAEKARGVVCASAGNHAQGVAYSCKKLEIYGKIYMPVTTPKQKVAQVEMFGGRFVEILLVGDTFDDAHAAAMADAAVSGQAFIHPFDDELVIAGQSTIALEIFAELQQNVDFLLVPVGGGGLLAGLVAVFRALSPQTKIIGIEPLGAPSLTKALEHGAVVNLPKIDKFVDGAAVREVGQRNFEIVKNRIYKTVCVPEGKVCTTILRLYNEHAIVVEPAGALSIAALDLLGEDLIGKNVVCIVSGSNNDIARTEEIKEKSLLYEGLKHYFMIEFPQRPGALKSFVNNVLGEHDDITYFQFSQKNSKELGPAVVGIELTNPADFPPLKQRLSDYGFNHTYLNDDQTLFNLLV